jgi:hypothetical protein
MKLSEIAQFALSGITIQSCTNNRLQLSNGVEVVLSGPSIESLNTNLDPYWNTASSLKKAMGVVADMLNRKRDEKLREELLYALETAIGIITTLGENSNNQKEIAFSFFCGDFVYRVSHIVTEPDEWWSEQGFDIHYDEDENTISVYIQNDTTNTIYTQRIK